MNKPIDLEDRIRQRASEDSDFRERLLDRPQATIEREFGVALAADQRILVVEDTAAATHMVLPPRSKRSVEDREAARIGAASLEFLKKTMYDPAPPIRPPEARPVAVRPGSNTPEAAAKAGREAIRRGLAFLESTLDDNGAWHCIRFNIADPDIPRHFEKPAFISAVCVLALAGSGQARARALCIRTRAHLIDTMEYPGLWRYYRHLPQDLDSTALSSLAIGDHPWMALGRNLPPILANRDEEGRFMTWVLAEGEPNVMATFRIEADPVVNANVIAYLGDRPETTKAIEWLEAMIAEDKIKGASKWYPDQVTAYYAIARAVLRTQPALDALCPMLTDRILALRDANGEFGNVLQTAQAISALDDVGSLGHIDARREVERFVDSQREDGSWPELLAFGDQGLRWGVIGQIGHGSEAVTSAFCVEALERLVETLSS